MAKVDILKAVEYLTQGKVIAYPTEAVFGLGCDPDNESAVMALLSIKKRSIKKGVILIGAHLDQFLPYIDLSKLDQDQQDRLHQSNTEHPITWIVPKQQSVPYYLSGEFDSLAIRVTQHPTVIELCRAVNKPIISTSANLSGYEPCRTSTEVLLQFGEAFPVLDGSTLGLTSPSEIRDIRSQAVLRSR